ncbi:MAG: hypothetical protein ACLT98_14425 [Eggerthellaceae bacterium]
MVARFVEALANPANTAALFEVLTSDMMRLSADDLLALTTEEDPETGCVRRRVARRIARRRLPLRRRAGACSSSA